MAGEFVYIGSDNYNFYCFNAISGNLVWTYTTNNFIETSPVVFGGNVYIGSGNGNLYCLNAFTGIQVWNYSPRGMNSYHHPPYQRDIFILEILKVLFTV